MSRWLVRVEIEVIARTGKEAEAKVSKGLQEANIEACNFVGVEIVARRKRS